MILFVDTDGVDHGGSQTYIYKGKESLTIFF